MDHGSELTEIRKRLNKTERLKITGSWIADHKSEIREIRKEKKKEGADKSRSSIKDQV